MAVPAAMAVTMPETETVAMEVLLLDQMPPIGLPESGRVEPRQIFAAPAGVIVGGGVAEPYTSTVKPVTVANTVEAQGPVDVCCCEAYNWKLSV